MILGSLMGMMAFFSRSRSVPQLTDTAPDRVRKHPRPTQTTSFRHEALIKQIQQENQQHHRTLDQLDLAIARGQE